MMPAPPGSRLNIATAQRLCILLAPHSEVRSGEVEEVLVNAIATIRDVVARAAGGDDPRMLSASTIDISFAVTQTGSISLGADGELANELTHTLRLGLAPGSA